MCGIFTDPHEIARSLAVAAAGKVVVNQTGKSVEESNAELGRQMAILYRTILSELSREEDDDVLDFHSHSHVHGHGDDGHEHSHSHDHEHVHDHSH